MTEARAHQRRSISLDAPLTVMDGVGPKRAAALEACGLRTVRDLLYHLPSRYEDWRGLKLIHEIRPGVSATVAGELGSLNERPMARAPGRRLLTGRLTDSRGDRLRLVWFNLAAHMRAALPAGRQVLIHGKVSVAPDGALEIAHPELHVMVEGVPAPALRPVYRVPAGVGRHWFAKLIGQALDEAALRVEAAIPAAQRARIGIAAPGEELRSLHDPAPDADLDALNHGRTRAHRALALDEMFAFQLALARERQRAAGRPGIAHAPRRTLTARFLAGLPFRLTGAQSRALEEIEADMARPRQMNRLLMGDVGSGKTVVALWAALRAVECGRQAVVMAPTELLAEQHYRTFEALGSSLSVRAGFLSGKVANSRRAALLAGLASGELALVFGTQALLQRDVRLRDLGLAIIDEQHRFGVFERARLMALGPYPDVLLMTATPIPRSLALTLFANLDFSVLDELPPRPGAVSTRIFAAEQLDAVEALVRREVESGNRAYYVVPLIEDDDEEERLSLRAAASRLCSGAFKGLRLGTLHGRMRPADKEQVMRRFRDGALDVLVATTVVEVGIDVPEATAMVVLAAERYGLAQLHQLRGRVGRGQKPSHCCLVLSSQIEGTARARLEVMAASASGAEVARADLALRGPGDLLGSRQAGPLPLRFVSFVDGLDMIEQARVLAEECLASDPRLEAATAQGARRALERIMEAGFSLGDVG